MAQPLDAEFKAKLEKLLNKVEIAKNSIDWLVSEQERLLAHITDPTISQMEKREARKRLHAFSSRIDFEERLTEALISEFQTLCNDSGS